MSKKNPANESRGVTFLWCRQLTWHRRPEALVQLQSRQSHWLVRHNHCCNPSCSPCHSNHHNRFGETCREGTPSRYSDHDIDRYNDCRICSAAEVRHHRNHSPGCCRSRYNFPNQNNCCPNCNLCCIHRHNPETIRGSFRRDPDCSVHGNRD